MALGCRRVATVNSANRHRVVQAIGTNTTNNIIAGTEARCKMDTHANTCVASPNFVVVEYTGEHCNVRPYSNQYKPITDVPIVNAATAYTDPETGETVILRCNQVLWNGKKMVMSLIIPNQMRQGGLVVLDDPTDHDCVFGITGDDFTIPLDILGTTVFSHQGPKQEGNWQLAVFST